MLHFMYIVGKSVSLSTWEQATQNDDVPDESMTVWTARGSNWVMCFVIPLEMFPRQQPTSEYMKNYVRTWMNLQDLSALEDRLTRQPVNHPFVFQRGPAGFVPVHVVPEGPDVELWNSFCKICGLEPGRLWKTWCGHSFCEDCKRGWDNNSPDSPNPSCPSCRKPNAWASGRFVDVAVEGVEYIPAAEAPAVVERHYEQMQASGQPDEEEEAVETVAAVEVTLPGPLAGHVGAVEEAESTSTHGPQCDK